MIENHHLILTLYSHKTLVIMRRMWREAWLSYHAHSKLSSSPPPPPLGRSMSSFRYRDLSTYAEAYQCSSLGLLVTYEAMLFYPLLFELQENILLIYLYILRTAKSNIIFHVSKKIHMTFYLSLIRNYISKLVFQKYIIDVNTTRLRIIFCKESSCGEIWNYISHFYITMISINIKSILLQGI